MALTKVTSAVIKDSTITDSDIGSTLTSAISGSFTAASSSLSSRITTNASNMTLATASIAAITASLGQPVNTDSNVTFGTITSGDINSSGTITATEIHTTFVSSSIAIASGSNIFGDDTADSHQFTGSLNVSGSLFVKDGTLTVTDNVDFNGDLDVDGTTNLDVVDIDGAVDMASTLAVGGAATFTANPIIQSDTGTLNFYNASGTQRAFLQLSSTGLVIDTDSFLQFKPNNTEAMYINSSGFVGIQTHDNSGDLGLSNTFGAPLHVLQKTASQPYAAIFQGNSNANGARIGIAEADSNLTNRDNTLEIGFDSSTDFIFSRTGKDMIIAVSGSEKVRMKTSATIFSGDNLVGIGQGSPTNSPLEVNLTQSNGTAGSSGFAHFGSAGNTDGHIQGISLGYRESNANYRKIAIAVRGRGDGATRSDLCFLVDTANDAASATLQDAKLTIDGLTGDATFTNAVTVNSNLLGGGQRFATSGKSVNVGSSTTFDISGTSSGFVFVKIIIKVGWNGNATYQMHSQYNYVTCNYATTGGESRSDIVQVEAGNAQFNYSDFSISRPSDRTVRLTYAPSGGSGSHTCNIYVSGVFDALS